MLLNVVNGLFVGGVKAGAAPLARPFGFRIPSHRIRVFFEDTRVSPCCIPPMLRMDGAPGVRCLPAKNKSKNHRRSFDCAVRFANCSAQDDESLGADAPRRSGELFGRGFR